jgi:hypothetical protein
VNRLVARRSFLGLRAGSAVAVLGGATTVRLLSGADPVAAQETAPAPPATTTVSRRDLVVNAELDGRLGYGDAVELPAQRSGTVTWQPDAGSVIEPGGVLWRTDDRPVILVRGDLPAFRPLTPGIEGTDVGQLQVFLVEQGHLALEDVDGEQEFDSATVKAVKAWQEALGLRETGRVELGDLVFWPEAVRVADRLAAPGAPSGGAVISVTSTDQAVRLDVATDDLSLVAEGDKVQVELPDGNVVPGTVSSVGRVATAPEQGGDPTVPVVIELDSPAEQFDEAPVTVLVEREAARDVLAVPVAALVALAEGGYALERVAADGTTSLVSVDIGTIVDGVVEVTGDIAEGDTVVMAA